MASDRELDWDSVSEERDSERNFRERLELELHRLHRESLRKRNAREVRGRVDLENKVGTERREATEDGNGGVGNWKNTERGLAGKDSSVGCKKKGSCDDVMATVIGQISRLREQDYTSDEWNRGDQQSNKGDLQRSKGDLQRSRCDAQMSRCDAQRSKCDVDKRIWRSDAWSHGAEFDSRGASLRSSDQSTGGRHRGVRCPEESSWSQSADQKFEGSSPGVTIANVAPTSEPKASDG